MVVEDMDINPINGKSLKTEKQTRRLGTESWEIAIFNGCTGKQKIKEQRSEREVQRTVYYHGNQGEKRFKKVKGV